MLLVLPILQGAPSFTNTPKGSNCTLLSNYGIPLYTWSVIMPRWAFSMCHLYKNRHIAHWIILSKVHLSNFCYKYSQKKQIIYIQSAILTTTWLTVTPRAHVGVLACCVVYVSVCTCTSVNVNQQFSLYYKYHEILSWQFVPRKHIVLSIVGSAFTRLHQNNI